MSPEMRRTIERRTVELFAQRDHPDAAKRAYANRHILRWSRVLGSRYSTIHVYADGRFDGAT